MLVRTNTILRTEPSTSGPSTPLPASAPASFYHGNSGKLDIARIADLVAKTSPAGPRAAEKAPSYSSKISTSKPIVEELQGIDRQNIGEEEQSVNQQAAQELHPPVNTEAEERLKVEAKLGQHCSVAQETPTQQLHPCKASTSVPNDTSDAKTFSLHHASKRRRINVTKLKHALKTGSIRVMAQFED
ncbi:hypothetical protein VTP01DRAFT_6525 [Rhizomucor pusillus]|uniref:uncharacterized protein n=1 Tax=Rhizomucor pusillus TaxID=4840 RepID=UPI003742E627